MNVQLVDIGTYHDNPVKAEKIGRFGMWRLWLYSKSGTRRSNLRDPETLDQSWFTLQGARDAAYKGKVVETVSAQS